MARVVVLTTGTYGDVAPYVGLGTQLQRAGHRVRIGAAESFRGVVTDAGLDFAALTTEDPHGLAAKPEAQAAGRPGGRGTASAIRLAAETLRRQVPEMISATADADVVLCTLATVLLGVPVAEARGVPCLVVPLQIAEPTRHFGPTFLGGRNLGGWLNKAVPTLVGRLGTRAFARQVRQVRADLGLPAKPGEGYRPGELTLLHGISPTVVPRPPDWRPDVELAGYWWPPRPSGWQPSAELVDFLAAGPEPIYVGFGSSAIGRVEALGGAVRDALAGSGQRAIVRRGWAQFSVDRETVLTVDDVPHDWLFPQMAAVVHHAGAGTTAAALRAGVPSVPVPASLDQPFWARRLVALGAAPRAIPMGKLRADRLGSAITDAISDPGYRRAATSVSERLSMEDGATCVIETIATRCAGCR